MKRIALIASAVAFAAMPASAENLLGGLLGQAQTNVKATAFDSAVESQAPGAKVLTDNLSAEQKAQVFDYAVDNSGTIGQAGSVLGGTGSGGSGAALLGAGAAALGGGYATSQQPQPVYGQQQPVYGQQPAVQTYQQQPAVQTYQQQPAVQTFQQQPAATTFQQPEGAYQQPGATNQSALGSYQQPAQVNAYQQPAPAQQQGVSIDPSTGAISVSPSAIGALGGLVTGN